MDFVGINRAIHRLHTQCKRAKRTRPSSTQAAVEIDSLFDGIVYSYSSSRALFDELNRDYFRKSMGPVKCCNTAVSIGTSLEFVMVRGSTRSPKVQSMIQEFFNGRSRTGRDSGVQTQQRL